MKTLINFLVVVALLWSVGGAQTVTAQTFDCNTVSDVPVEECEALLALYNGTNGSGWSNHMNWLQSTSVGEWYGISVNDGHVQVINLNDNNLQGSIPPELGNLSQLRRLFLSGNQLSGSIPPELGNLSQLQWLGLYGNQLSGSIPPELGNLSQLQNLYLGFNQLSGSIPPELGNLSQLVYLYLNNNQLSGSIPPELGNLSQLVRLYLFSNQLSGSIPPELGNLSQLVALYLYNNQLSGSIPPELGNLSQLVYLYLGNNQLSGDVPEMLANLVNLQDLYLGYNRLNVPDGYPRSDNDFHQFLYQKDNNWHLYQSISATIPESGGTLVSRDGEVKVEVPDEVATQAINLTFIPQPVPSQSASMVYTGKSFQLIAEDGSGNRLRVFNAPLQITISYTEESLAGADEDALFLLYWDEEEQIWKDAATTCNPAGAYTRNKDENWFSVGVCHLTEFGVFSPLKIYLPLVRR